MNTDAESKKKKNCKLSQRIYENDSISDQVSFICGMQGRFHFWKLVHIIYHIN